MKRIFSILMFAAVLLTSCKDKEVVSALAPVPAPTWFTNEDYFNEKNGMYVEMPIDTNCIVMLGDDYMDRGEWQLFFNNKKIRNRGIALDGTEHVRYRVDSIAVKHPKIIFVSAGMRDVLHGDAADSTVSRVLEIMDRAKTLAPKTALYYLGTIPTGKMDAGQIAKVGEINTKLSEAAQNGKFKYIDIPAVVVGDKGTLSDKYTWNGVNLNGAGYEVYAKAIEEYIGTPALNKANDRKYKEITDYYKHRVSIFNSLPNTYNFIIMLGNSLNNNALWVELLPFTSVINRGISGDVIEGVYNRIDDIAEEKPNKIYLMIGTNDIINNKDIKVSELWASYEKLIKKIRSDVPKAYLYIQSTLPLNPKSKYYEGFNPKVEELNKLLAANTGKYNYIYLDIAEKMKDDKGDLKAEYTTDGVHLSANGYFVWATQLAQGNRMIIMDDVNKYE
ncbi:MAG: GDSL-type esterase/lipase family protein [Bacteroidales bacterium]|nr:GDSL-type esterase/lipase family protein [Bacteroidales bacterium]MDD4670599.1 GDSL-type esterase/lipase family protein [Bacteroidales bacterium]